MNVHAWIAPQNLPWWRRAWQRLTDARPAGEPAIYLILTALAILGISILNGLIAFALVWYVVRPIAQAIA